MRFKHLIFAVIILILATPILVSADNTNQKSYANYKFFIHDKEVSVSVTYNFTSPRLVGLGLTIPKDSTNIKLKIDGQDSRPTIIESKDAKTISIYRILKKMELSYDSKSLLKRNIFIVDLESPLNFSRLDISVKLAPNYMLEKPIRKGTFSSASIYPEPARMETDGQSIIFVWEYNNTQPNRTYPVILLLKEKTNKLLIYITLALFVSFVFVFILFLRKKPKVNKVIVKKIDKITSHLKEDEEQVLNVLKQKGGKCDQGTLRVVTGMSKAKLSQLLKELEERKIIKKVKKGKKNVIVRL